MNEIVVRYLQQHGYNILDAGVMPFEHGITLIDIVAYDPRSDCVVGVKVYDGGRPMDVSAEWKFRDGPYFKRATRRYCEKYGWRTAYRADSILVTPFKCVDHVVGEKKTIKKRRMAV